MRAFIVAATYEAFLAFGKKWNEYRRESYDHVFVSYKGKLPVMDDPTYRTVLAPDWRQHPQAMEVRALILERNLEPAATEIRRHEAQSPS